MASGELRNAGFDPGRRSLRYCRPYVGVLRPYYSGPGLRTLFMRGGMGGAELAKKGNMGRAVQTALYCCANSTGCADSTLLLCEQHDSLLLLVR